MPWLRLTSGLAMNIDENPRRARGPLLSPEALVGIGITVAEIGILCLLLGWAEHMRSVPAMAWTWLVLGGALFILGGIAALSARPKDPRRIPAERAPEDPSLSEPEERLE
jgi:hypothetical protein